jgi:hypothetical protein
LEEHHKLTLGNIFVDLVNFKLKKKFPYLKAYNTFCGKYDDIIQTAEELKKTSKNFKKFLMKKECQPEVNFQSFQSFLILPVQRLPRYVMLLEAVIKLSEKDESDYEKLCEAYNRIKEVADFVNLRIKELAFKEKLIEITDATKGIEHINLLYSSRKFLKEGIVGYVSKKGLRQRLIILFTDLILILKINVNKGSPEEEDILKNLKEKQKQKKKKDYMFTLRSAISFDNEPNAHIIKIIDGELLKHTFLFVSSEKTFCFFFKTNEKMEEWYQEINTQLEETTAKTKDKGNLYFITKGNYANASYPKNHILMDFLPNLKEYRNIEFTQKQKQEEKKKFNKRGSLFTNLFANKRMSTAYTQKNTNILDISDSEDEEEDEKKPKHFEEILKNKK